MTIGKVSLPGMERIYFKTVEMLDAYGGGKGQSILKSFVPVKVLS